MSFNKITHDTNNFTAEALTFRYKKFQAKKAFERSFILGLILFTIWFQDWTESIWMKIIILAIGMCLILHILFALIVMVQLISEKPLYGTKRQRKLLNIEENSMLLKVVKPLPIIRKNSNPDISKIPCQASLENRRNAEIVSSTPIKSFSYSSKAYKDFKSKINSQNYIADEKSLRQYIEDYERKQQENNLELTIQSNIRSPAITLLRTSLYQTAIETTIKPQSPLANTNNYTNNLKTDILGHLTLDQLTKYVLNLRHWISSTILKPLITEIDNVNNVFERLMLSDLRIGETGLEQLRSLLSQQKFIAENVPRLPMIVEYLEICLNQIYLLERLRSLSDGTWLVNYTCRMDATANFLNLPNDATIIFECICKYLDKQLQNLTHNGEIYERPFYDKYIIKNENSKYPLKSMNNLVRNRAGCAIIYTKSIPPKFNFITKEKVYFGQYGFNNLFHVLLAFFIYLKGHNNGMLEEVSLGRNGINLLWTFGESNCK